MDQRRTLGLGKPREGRETEQQRIRRYISLKLAASGYPVHQGDVEEEEFLEIAGDLIALYREKSRLLSDYLPPADWRIQKFLNKFLSDVEPPVEIKLPHNTLLMDRYGIARELSIPRDGYKFINSYIESYRVKQGVLHNPKHDRRTTHGTFHIVEGSDLPIPADKKAVPKLTFAKILKAAFNPPEELLILPYTSEQEEKAKLFVSLLIRPVVCPEVPGISTKKTMEIRFFAPGSLVSALDFVESIFGNGGNPFLPENDAALDVEHWTGHTGCVILAPHLTQLTKKELGLPPIERATERQKKDRMCWEREDELYNDGLPFKLTARTKEGVIVTVIADNYFGYCKKEVKTQISFASNLYGNTEEEHAGGALIFPSYHLGDVFRPDSRMQEGGHKFSEVVELLGDRIELREEGYGVDRLYPDLVYIPENAQIDLNQQRISWRKNGEYKAIKLKKGKVYMHPSGYKVRLEKHPGAPSWRLVGTSAEGLFCHKPCTVSGGGKSEISKPLDDGIIYGPIYVSDLQRDLDMVEEILKKDFRFRFKPELRKPKKRSRPILSPERTLGSVIKLLTPSPEYTDEYNQWLRSIPSRIRALLFIIKRFYQPEWGDNWRKYFSVDVINGSPGHELKFKDRKVVGSYLRVGFDEQGCWRTYKLRQDFVPAEKVQLEDDISVSILVPKDKLPNYPADLPYPYVKVVHNCEYRIFQRPDDAIHRGYDKQTESDLSKPGNFCVNYEPLPPEKVKEIVDDAIGFDQFTQPMKEFLAEAAREEYPYTVCSAIPRIINGKPSKNPRYLQLRPDLANPFKTYVSFMGIRLHRRIPLPKPVIVPVQAVFPGRRNNPPNPQAGHRPLCVYNPIHYQELPELFMDFISSLSGKSPSTTGAGSEGALTKGPFNALLPAADLNNALVSFILSGYPGFSSPAGYIGPYRKIDHDISLLIPELWSRLSQKERDPEFLIKEGFLEKLEDYEYKGKMILASRLGYRITPLFVHEFLGRIFDDPALVFDELMLKPESQDPDAFADGIDYIVESQRRIALQYFEDGSVEQACPPLKALLHIMAYGHYEGKDAQHPDIRKMFTREYLLNSQWYKERLETKQKRDIELWQRHVHTLEEYLKRSSHRNVIRTLKIQQRLEMARSELKKISSEQYLRELHGYLGADQLDKIE